MAGKAMCRSDSRGQATSSPWRRQRRSTVGDDVLQQRDGHARRHARLLVHELAAAGLERHILDQLAKVLGDHDAGVAIAALPRLLPGDRQGVLHVGRVVVDDLRVDAVLQRRDDVAAVGVVLGVGREHHAHVERDAQREAADLEVLLFEDVEQPHLDARRQVGAPR